MTSLPMFSRLLGCRAANFFFQYNLITNMSFARKFAWSNGGVGRNWWWWKSTARGKFPWYARKSAVGENNCWKCSYKPKMFNSPENLVCSWFNLHQACSHLTSCFSHWMIGTGRGVVWGRYSNCSLLGFAFGVIDIGTKCVECYYCEGGEEISMLENIELFKRWETNADLKHFVQHPYLFSVS